MNTLITSIEAAEVMLGFSDLDTRDEVQLAAAPEKPVRTRLEWCRRAVHGKREEEIAGVAIARGKWSVNVFGESAEDRMLPLPLFWATAEAGDDRLVIMLHKTDEVAEHMRQWHLNETRVPLSPPDNPPADRWRLRVAASNPAALARFGVLFRLTEN